MVVPHLRRTFHWLESSLLKPSVAELTVHRLWRREHQCRTSNFNNMKEKDTQFVDNASHKEYERAAGTHWLQPLR